MKQLARYMLLLAALALLPLSASAETYLNNADVMPPYRPDSEVTLEDDGHVVSPDWLKDAIITQVRLETATEEGTFAAAEKKVLDHYQETGVNVLWIMPIWDRTDASPNDNGYGNLGLHTVWPKLTGTTDYAEGFRVVKHFVEEAHKRNIRVLFDIIAWGTTSDAPLFTEHREFYSGTPGWGGMLFNWNSQALQKWYVEQAVNFIVNTGADGFRCDLEPYLFGSALWRRVRESCLEKGRKIVLMSETANERDDTFDLEENGVGTEVNADNYYTHFDNAFMGRYEMVDAVKNGYGIGSQAAQKAGTSGQYRYYTYCLMGANHFDYIVAGSRLVIGYNALFAPFVPVWYMGDEFNNDSEPFWGTTVAYFSRLYWDQLEKPENRAFFEDVKRMIRIRRQYADIFTYFPDNHRDSNICAVKTTSMSTLSSYARFADGRMIVIVPNDDVRKTSITVTLPYEAAGVTADGVTVTDLMTGKQVASGKRASLSRIKVSVEPDSVGVYLVAPSAKPTVTTTAKTTESGEPTAPATEKSADTTAPIETEEPIETTAPVETEEPAETIAPTETEEPTYTEEPAIDNQPFPWVWVAAGGGAVIVAAIVLIAVISKKKKV